MSEFLATAEAPPFFYPGCLICVCIYPSIGAGVIFRRLSAYTHLEKRERENG